MAVNLDKETVQFASNTWDRDLLYPITADGAVAMSSKLCTYAQNQLPGGMYYDPEPAIKKILENISPSNDLCESILGLNDYLHTLDSRHIR